MSVTLQEIAEAAGVSRGTVDRALNHRGRIRADVAEKIRKIAEEMGYQPNIAGRTLAVAKRNLRLGVIVQNAETPFIRELLKGTEKAKAEVESFGGKVELRLLEGVEEQSMPEILEELRASGCSGLAVIATDHDRINEALRRLIQEENIPVITFNTDAPHSGRLCFVGQDSRRSGMVVAGLFDEILPEKVAVGVISGRETHTGLRSRIEGFSGEIGAGGRQTRLAEVKYTNESEAAVYAAAKELMARHPDLRGIYLTANGEEGLVRALKESGAYGRIKVIAHDFSKKKLECLTDGGIQFLIGQDSYTQGYEPVMLLFRYLVNAEKPAEEFLYTEIAIKTRYNL